MRILIVLNENPLGSHPDVYEAFDALVAEGMLGGYDVVPYLHMRASGDSDVAIVARIVDLVRTGGHELIIWMHTGTLCVDDTALEAILSAPQRPKMAYWEGDSYHPFYKPVPKQMLAIMGRCDRVYIPGGGPMISSLIHSGVRSAYYAPNCASGTRFPHVWDSEDAHGHCIVVVGNRVSSKLPFRTMPGARGRRKMVHALIARYGCDVAVYGAGWVGDCMQGQSDFSTQGAIYAGSDLTVGIDNFSHEAFFSNRLPIALASGVPIVYRRSPGYELVFPKELDDIFFDTWDEMFAAIDRILSMGRAELSAISARNRDFFERSLSRRVVLRFILQDLRGESVPVGHRESRPLWQDMRPLVVAGRCG